MRTTLRIAMLATGALVALAFVSGCSTKVVTTQGAPVDSVTASGTGRVMAAPDIATMSFGVELNDAEAQAALARAAKVADDIVAALRKAGVKPEDLQTSGVNLYPTQSTEGDKVVVTGYQASISVSAKVRDIGEVGKVIEAASAAGALNISGPAFEMSEDSDQRARSIELAVAAARKNAETMARAAGKSVGDVISITASNVSVPLPLMRDAGVAAESLDIPIEAGQLEVAADVTVMYELE